MVLPKRCHLMIVGLWLVFMMVITQQNVLAGDLEKSPPSFQFDGRSAVFVDFQSVDLALTFDVGTSKAMGHARVVFEVAEVGLPVFDMIPDAMDIKLNGVSLAPSDLIATKDPDKQTNLRILKSRALPVGRHTMEINYALSQEVFFDQESVAAGFFMSDLVDRQYWEQYAPSNFEFDQYSQVVDLKVTGSAQAHEIFANGTVKVVAFNQWQIVYPPYFTTSSFYFHLVKAGRFFAQRSIFAGVDADIPLTVYGMSATNVSTAMTALRGYLEELEAAYGAFAHASFTAYITETDGGMEYCGATVTSLRALGHETTHSWFARGVMPANGNAGWIDEAIASWRDYGYPRSQNSNRTPKMLGGFSPYRRWTTRDAYSYGAGLISDLDAGAAEANGFGMRSVIRDLYEKFKRQVVMVSLFQQHLEASLGSSMQEFFDRYIYGKNLDHVDTREAIGEQGWGRHPRPFTKGEWIRLR
jgi:hypothetical protein